MTIEDAKEKVISVLSKKYGEKKNNPQTKRLGYFETKVLGMSNTSCALSKCGAVPEKENLPVRP